MAPRRQLLTPDYAGAIRNGINENLNGTRTSSSNFAVPSMYSGTDRSTSGAKRVMSRTSGVARRASTTSAGEIRLAQKAKEFYAQNPDGLSLNQIDAGFGALPRVFGTLFKALIPASTRIAGAATRVANNATRANQSREAASDALRAGAREGFDAAAALRAPTYVGTDVYKTTSRQVDALFDKWETSSFRLGNGPSAWQRAQDLARETGRTVSRSANDFGNGEKFRLLPTAAEIAEAEAKDRAAGAALRQADSLVMGRSPLAGNPTAARREIERRLRGLRQAK